MKKKERGVKRVGGGGGVKTGGGKVWKFGPEIQAAIRPICQMGPICLIISSAPPLFYTLFLDPLFTLLHILYPYTPTSYPSLSFHSPPPPTQIDTPRLPEFLVRY